MKGSVKIFNTTKGFGFITIDDSEESVFVHQSDLLQDGYRKLARGEKVEFEMITDDDDRTKAIQVTKL